MPRIPILAGALFLMTGGVATGLVSDLLVAVAYEGDVLPLNAAEPWRVVTNPDSIHSVRVVADSEADDGLALELTGRRMFWDIAAADLGELSNVRGWLLDARHLSISNTANPDLDATPFSNQPDTVVVSDGVLIVFVDFRPDQLRVTTRSLGGVPCSAAPDVCRVWNHSVGDYVTLRILGQGNQITVWVNDEAPWMGQVGDTFGKTLSFGNADTAIRHDAEARWDHLRLDMGGLTLNATIDIQPGDPVGCINQNGHGAIPVAVFGNSSFDVFQVDVATVRLASMSVKMVGKADRPLAHYEDLDGDGFTDLVIQIADRDGELVQGDSTATLTGQLLDGRSFSGQDEICVR